jgi:aminoglycoside N3'-acetyltransferase
MDAFVELGRNVLFPNFNFQSWTEGHYWDYYETPSKMGIITEFSRKEFPRTFHPIYPFAVAGPDAKEYQRCDDEEAFGLGSPFNKFYLDEGLIVSVGLDDFTQTFTPVHFAEFLTGIDYRYQKSFHGIYRGFLANPKIRTFTAFVRCDDVINNPNPASYEMINRGIIRFETLSDGCEKTSRFPCSICRDEGIH